MGNSIRHICASLALVWSHRAYYLWRNITEQQQDRGFIEYANAFQTLIVCNTLKVWNDSTIDQHTWNLPKTPRMAAGEIFSIAFKEFPFPLPPSFHPSFLCSKYQVHCQTPSCLDKFLYHFSQESPSQVKCKAWTEGRVPVIVLPWGISQHCRTRTKQSWQHPLGLPSTSSLETFQHPPTASPKQNLGTESCSAFTEHFSSNSSFHFEEIFARV